MGKSRLIYADILRIIASIFVVVIHTSSQDWHSFKIGTLNWHWVNIYDGMSRWCVPLFIMISGIFFLDVTKKITYKYIYRKSIFKILCTLFFWSIFYGIFALFYLDKGITVYNVVSIFMKIFFGPAWYHLWFLYTIIGLYILTPIIRIFIKNAQRRDIEYLLLIFVFLGTLLPALNHLLPMINPALIINFSIIELQGYLGYFVAGYYFSVYNLSHKMTRSIYALGLLSIVFTILITYLLSVFTGKADGFFYDFVLINVPFSAFAIFLFIKNKMSTMHISDKNIKIIQYISSCTFGVYLLHPLFINLFNDSLVSMFSSTMIKIPILTVFYFTLSFITTVLIKKIPLVSKYIV